MDTEPLLLEQDEEPSVSQPPYVAMQEPQSNMPSSSIAKSIPGTKPGRTAFLCGYKQLTRWEDEDDGVSQAPRVINQQPQSTTPSSPSTKPIPSTKSGLKAFLHDRIHLTHWECCNCGDVHENKHFKWILKEKENCSKHQRCVHERCDGCYDLDGKGIRRQLCNGKECNPILAPLWVEASPRPGLYPTGFGL